MQHSSQAMPLKVERFFFQKINMQTRVKELWKLWRVISQTHKISKQLSRLTNKLQSHGITRNQGMHTNYGDGRWSVRKEWSALTHIEGFDSVLQQLVGKLLEENSQCQVLSICKMGGSG